MTRHLSFRSTFVRREEVKNSSRIFAHDGGLGSASCTACHRISVSESVQDFLRRTAQSVTVDTASIWSQLGNVRLRFRVFLGTLDSGNFYEWACSSRRHYSNTCGKRWVSRFSPRKKSRYEYGAHGMSQSTFEAKCLLDSKSRHGRSHGTSGEWYDTIETTVWNAT